MMKLGLRIDYYLDSSRVAVVVFLDWDKRKLFELRVR